MGSTMGDLRRIFEAATECTMKGEHSHQVILMQMNVMNVMNECTDFYEGGTQSPGMMNE